jgi:DNA primase
VISERTIQLVRERTDLVALIGETVKLARAGRSWKGLCPFHKERSPSFHVTPERGRFHCFGCQEGGNCFDFVIKVEGCSFPEAVRRLAERSGIEIEEDGSPQQRREEVAQRKAKEDLYGAMSLAAVYYETMLREHPFGSLAQDELVKRGLVAETPTDTIATALQAFRIGYAPAGFDGLTSYFRTHGISPAVAAQVGLLRAREGGNGYYDSFRNRLMFAVVDLQGRVVAFSGRILPDPKTGLVDKDTGKYINSPETPIYRKGETVFGLFQARQAIRQAEMAVLVEGNFDVVSLHARGIANVVAPLGTAFTPDQAALIKRFTPTVTLLFDGDAAGRKACRAAREPCRRAGLSARAAVLPEGVDPDDLARNKGPEAVTAVIKAARGLLEHLIAACLDEGFVRADSEEKAARAREVVELLTTEEDPTVRAMAQTFADEIAGRLASADPMTGMMDVRTFSALSRSVKSALNAPRPPSDSMQGSHPNAADPARTARKDALSEAVIGCLLDFPVLLNEPDVEASLGYLDGEAVFVIAALRQVNGEDFFGLDAEEFLAKVPPSFHSFARHRLAAPEHQDLESARSVLLDNAEKLKRRVLTRDNARAREEATQKERMGEVDESFELLREVQEAARRKRRIGGRAKIMTITLVLTAGAS